jgi:tRNA(Ile2) C34 agmatinyltransferase TiaS
MIELDLEPENVVANRKKIDLEIKKMQAQIKALEGLHAANQAVCEHARKRDVYDPGYAGGGHDGYRCDDCGRRGYF